MSDFADDRVGSVLCLISVWASEAGRWSEFWDCWRPLISVWAHEAGMWLTFWGCRGSRTDAVCGGPVCAQGWWGGNGVIGTGGISRFSALKNNCEIWNCKKDRVCWGRLFMRTTQLSKKDSSTPLLEAVCFTSCLLFRWSLINLVNALPMWGLVSLAILLFFGGLRGIRGGGSRPEDGDPALFLLWDCWLSVPLVAETALDLKANQSL